jgi:hypothetical protein
MFKLKATLIPDTYLMYGSIYLSIYPSIYLSIYPSIYLCICLSINGMLLARFQEPETNAKARQEHQLKVQQEMMEECTFAPNAAESANVSPAKPQRGDATRSLVSQSSSHTLTFNKPS